jgi:hypothetical protein
MDPGRTCRPAGAESSGAGGSYKHRAPPGLTGPIAGANRSRTLKRVRSSPRGTAVRQAANLRLSPASVLSPSVASIAPAPAGALQALTQGRSPGAGPRHDGARRYCGAGFKSPTASGCADSTSTADSSEVRLRLANGGGIGNDWTFGWGRASLPSWCSINPRASGRCWIG